MSVKTRILYVDIVASKRPSLVFFSMSLIYMERNPINTYIYTYMNVMSERIGYFKIKQRQHVVSLPCPHAKTNSLVRFTNV